MSDDRTTAPAVLQEALQLHQLGRLREAEDKCRKYLDNDPRNADVLNLLGIVLHGLGRLDASIEVFRASAALRPGDVAAQNNLGSALMAAQRTDQAIEVYERIVHLNPAYVAAHYNLGIAFFARGRLNDALDSFRRAVHLDSNNPELNYSVGVALYSLGDIREAVRNFYVALELKPDYLKALIGLGTALQEAGLYRDGLIIAERAITVDPKSMEANSMLARICNALDMRAEAEAAWRSVLSMDPASLDAICGLAELMKMSARLDTMQLLLDQGFALRPNHLLLNVIAAEHDIEIQDYHSARTRLVFALQQAESAVVGSGAVGKDILTRRQERRWLAPRIHFQLGRLYDAIGEYASAFEHFRQGNELTQKTDYACQFSKENYYKEIDVQLRYFDEPMVRNRREVAAAGLSEEPVFLVGFPRSGTTLLEQILDAHPRIRTMEEKDTVAVMEEALRDMTRNYAVSPFRLDDAQIDELRNIYFTECRQTIERLDRCILVDKLPLNLVKAGIINLVFPQARFILALRHPCDACLSCFMQNFELNNAMANFFTPEDAARLYVKAMGAWLFYQRRLNLRTHEIRYEDIVCHFRREVSRLLNYLGLEWVPELSQFHEHARNRRTIRTPSYMQVTRPIYDQSIYRWKHYHEQLTEMQRILEPFIKIWGYEN